MVKRNRAKSKAIQSSKQILKQSPKQSKNQSSKQAPISSRRRRPVKLQASGSNNSRHKQAVKTVEVEDAAVSKVLEPIMQQKESQSTEPITDAIEVLDRPFQNKEGKQAGEKQNKLDKLTHDRIYTHLSEACARSANLHGRLKRHQTRFLVELPTGLPSMLLLRALQKNAAQHKALTTERLMDAGQHTQLQLDVAGLSELQLQQFIAELDELIGEFTARS